AWSHALMVAKRVATPAGEEEEAEKINKRMLESFEEKSNRRNVQKNDNDSVTTNLPTDPDTMISIIESTLNTHSAGFRDQIGLLKDAGWDVETPSLETRPGRRFKVVE
ncbi:hypothetical protein ACJ72_06270, partial [Emergomyces africanus]